MERAKLNNFWFIVRKRKPGFYAEDRYTKSCPRWIFG